MPEFLKVGDEFVLPSDVRGGKNFATFIRVTLIDGRTLDSAEGETEALRRWFLGQSVNCHVGPLPGLAVSGSDSAGSAEDYSVVVPWETQGGSSPENSSGAGMSGSVADCAPRGGLNVIDTELGRLTIQTPENHMSAEDLHNVMLGVPAHRFVH